jgi:hypothetical protein
MFQSGFLKGRQILAAGGGTGRGREAAEVLQPLARSADPLVRK